MKFKQAINLAFQEEYSQRKYTRITFVLMTLAMILFVAVNSLTGSIKGSTENLLNKPYARLFSTAGPIEKMKEFYEELKEAAKESDVLGTVYESGQGFQMDWKDSKNVVKQDDVDIELCAWFGEMEEFLCDGDKKEVSVGEVIIPKYLYDVGVYNEYNYFDTTSLVGETITLTNEEYHSDTPIEYQFQIVGTYDNIKSSCDNFFFVNGTQLAELYTLHTQQTDEELLEIHEEFGAEIQWVIDECYGGDVLAYWRENNQVQTSVGAYVNPNYTMEDAEEFFSQLGEGGSPMISLDDSLMLYFDFIIYMGNLISILLLATAFVNILIMVSSEVQRRQGEFALKYAIGYRWKDIFLVFSFGKFICFFKAFLIAVVVTGVLIVGGNYVIQSVFPLYLRHLELTYDVKVLLLSAGVVVVGTVAGMCMALPFMKKINVAGILKKED